MIKAGFFETDITPKPGTHNILDRDYGAIDKIITPLSVTASVWQNENCKIAIIGVDIIIIKRDIHDRVLAALKEDVGVDYLIIGASHTHSGGPVRNWGIPISEVEKIDDIDPKVREEIINDMGVPDQEYLDLVDNQIIEAVREADKKLEPVRLINGKSMVEDVAYNRRFKMKSGYTITHPGKGNPDIVDYAGPVDKEVVVLGAVNEKECITGCIVNFACHATVGADGFSADWPYYMRETVKKQINNEMVPVFLNGYCGDVTQIKNLSTDDYRRGAKWGEILGQRVGFGAVDALTQGEPGEYSNLSCVSENMEIMFRTHNEQHYQQALRKLNTEYQKSDFHNKETVFFKHYLATAGPHYQCEINVVQIGNLLLVTNSFECFVQIGLDIKKASPFEYTMVAELVNDHGGYLPTADVFGPNGGGYEGRLCFGSFTEKKAAEKVRNQSVELVNKFTLEKEIAKIVHTNKKSWGIGTYLPDDF